MILVAYLHGLRASEVVDLKPANVKDGYLSVLRLKGSEATTQPLLHSLNPLLSERQAMIEQALNTPYFRPLFNVTRQTFFNLIRRYGKAAGIPAHQQHPHILKHTCGDHMYEKTKSLAITQKWLGHKSGTSTLVYLNTSQAKADAAAVEALCV